MNTFLICATFGFGTTETRHCSPNPGWQCGKFGALPIGDQPRSGGTQGVGTAGTAPCRQYLPVLGRGIWIYLHLNVAIQATTIITSKSIGVKPQVFKSFTPCFILQYWGVSQVAKVVLRHTLIRLFSWTALSRSSTFPPSSNCITGTVVNFMALGRAPAQVTDIYSSGLRHRSNCPSWHWPSRHYFVLVLSQRINVNQGLTLLHSLRTPLKFKLWQSLCKEKNQSYQVPKQTQEMYKGKPSFRNYYC